MRTATRPLALPLLLAGLAVCLLAPRPAAAQGRCGAGVDLVVQALERMTPSSPTSELEDANQLLKRAAELCAELGDAWYYRSLVERKLGHAPLADFALRQAQRFPSEANLDHENPFVLASPPLSVASRRGVDGPPAAGAAPAHPPERFALIVGIGSFADKSIESLQYTAADAQSFQAALVDPKVGHFKPENVHSLLNDQATTRNIKVQLNWLARSAQPDDLVVIYVATHGSSRDVDTVGVNYIITHDTEIGPGQKPDPDTLYATALPMVEISNAIATRVKARRAAIFLDTCFSGNAAKPDAANARLIAPGIANAAPSPQTLSHITQGAGRIIFAASGTEQESLESDILKHGLFTYYLVEALKQDGPNAPLSQIFDYTQKHVSDRAASEFRQYHLQQTPVLGRSDAATDFSLAPTQAPSAQLQPPAAPSIPAPGASIPAHETFISALGTRIPAREASIPAHEASISALGTRIPAREASIPAHETFISALGTRIPPREASIPTRETFVLASEIGPGFSPDIKRSQYSGFSPRDMLSLLSGKISNEAFTAEVLGQSLRDSP